MQMLQGSAEKQHHPLSESLFKNICRVATQLTCHGYSQQIAVLIKACMQHQLAAIRQIHWCYQYRGSHKYVRKEF